MTERRAHSMPDPEPSVVWYPGHDLLLPEIVRAENCSLWDAAGRRFVDLESGVWCTSIGHGHPRLLRVMAEQASRIAHTGFGYSSAVVTESAREILDLLGFSGGQCVFLCSGSEAVEYGVRVAQSLADRPLLLTMKDSYFGAYGSANRKRDDEWLCFDWESCAECSHPGDGSEPCEHFAAIPFDTIGGFVFEPGSSSGLVRFPPAPLVRRIVERIRAEGGLVMVNEVTTGLGRTGEWFGYQHDGLSPDIVALGKGLGNGYPVSVAAFAPHLAERLRAQPLKYSQSHQNDPLGAAIAREVVAIVRDEGLIERGREIAVQLRSGLEGIAQRAGGIETIRGRGLMLAVVLKDGPGTPLTLQAHRELVGRGYLVGRRPGLNVLRLDPSLTIERADVAGFLAAFEEVLGATEPTPASTGPRAA